MRHKELVHLKGRRSNRAMLRTPDPDLPPEQPPAITAQPAEKQAVQEELRDDPLLPNLPTDLAPLPTIETTTLSQPPTSRLKPIKKRASDPPPPEPGGRSQKRSCREGIWSKEFVYFQQNGRSGIQLPPLAKRPFYFLFSIL